MKTIRFLAILVLCVCSSSTFSQLKVDASGKILWGKSSYYSTPTSLYFQDDYSGPSTSTYNPFRIIRSSNGNVSLSRNHYRMVFYPLSGAMAIGNNVPDNDENSYVPLCIYSTTYGGMSVKLTSSSGFPGIKSSVDAVSGKPFSAYYNNTEVFYVNGSGQAYSNGSLLTSDISLKSNIEPISKSLEKVLQLRGVTFDMNFPQNEDVPVDFEEAFKKAQQATPSLTKELFKQIQDEKSRKRTGVIAQEVEKVMPELVRTREDGLKAVSYSEMAGLFIEAIKEQQKVIEELKLEIAAMKDKSSSGDLRSSTGITDLAEQCVLTQNAPNPFTNQTEIKYFVAQGVKDAYICIFDMQGKMLQKLNVAAGQNSIIINGSTLQAGMYLYSLVADGQEVDTKRMILTK
jgi:hypothetical protein